MEHIKNSDINNDGTIMKTIMAWIAIWAVSLAIDACETFRGALPGPLHSPQKRVQRPDKSIDLD